jgi:hypothetical protein
MQNVPDPSGPHLQAALICERVLQEQDGVVTAVRLIDRVNFVSSEDEERRSHPIAFLISLKAGAAHGSYTVRVEVETPSTERHPILEAPVFFEGGERGVNLVVNARFEPEVAGLYWYDVYFQETRLTRIPLRAIFQTLPGRPAR